MKTPNEKEFIYSIVKSSVMAYAEGFECRHVSEVNNPEGVINMKIHNVFIEALGKEIQYYTALSRSLDSSLGNMLEKMAIALAEQNYVVKRYLEALKFVFFCRGKPQRHFFTKLCVAHIHLRTCMHEIFF